MQFLNKGLATIGHMMMNAGAFVFDEMEEDRGEGHGRKQQLTKDKMHIKVH